MAAGGEIGSFGPVVFVSSTDMVRTWQTLAKKSTANFAQHQRLLQKPRQEFVGLGAREFRLLLRFDVQWGLNPTNELSALHDVLAQGRPHSLLLGHKPQGRYVLTSIEESWLYTDPDGNLLVVEAQIQLLEDGP